MNSYILFNFLLMSQLPEEIIDLILSYAPDFHDNLLSCHKEILTNHRPIYYKKVVHVLRDDDPACAPREDFERNDEIRLYKPPGVVFMKLKLYAIEITPEREIYGGEEEAGRWWQQRDINLYYGWTKISNKYFWDTLCEWNNYNNELCPGYY